MHRILYLLFALVFGVPVSAQVDSRLPQIESRISAVESRLSRLESKMPTAGAGGAICFLFAAFCALWAQNTGRSGWLWFFLGLFFNFIAVLVLLAKNSGDIDQGRRRQA